MGNAQLVINSETKPWHMEGTKRIKKKKKQTIIVKNITAVEIEKSLPSTIAPRKYSQQLTF